MRSKDAFQSFILMPLILLTLRTLLDGLKQQCSNHEMKDYSIEHDMAKKVEFIFDHPDYHQMTEQDLKNSIFAMKNFLRIIYKSGDGYSITFYHEENPFYELSGLYEIIFYDSITKYQLGILKRFGGDFIDYM